MLMYKGYMGHVEFDDEADIFHGEVINTRDVITFQGKSVTEIKKAFRECGKLFCWGMVEEFKKRIIKMKCAQPAFWVKLVAKNGWYNSWNPLRLKQNIMKTKEHDPKKEQSENKSNPNQKKNQETGQMEEQTGKKISEQQDSKQTDKKREQYKGGSQTRSQQEDELDESEDKGR